MRSIKELLPVCGFGGEETDMGVGGKLEENSLSAVRCMVCPGMGSID